LVRLQVPVHKGDDRVLFGDLYPVIQGHAGIGPGNELLGIDAVMYYRDLFSEPLRKRGCLPLGGGQTGIRRFKIHQVVDVLDPGPARTPARIPGGKLWIKSA